MFDVIISFKTTELGKKSEITHLPSEPCRFLGGKPYNLWNENDSDVKGRGDNLQLAALDYLSKWVRDKTPEEARPVPRSGKVEVTLEIQETSFQESGGGPEDCSVQYTLKFTATPSMAPPYEVEGSGVWGKGRTLPLAVIDYLQGRVG